MISTAPDFATFRPSTYELPERDRVGYRRELVEPRILEFDVGLAAVQPFQSESTGRMPPSLIIAWGVTADLCVPQTSERVTDGNDDILMPFTRGGSRVASQSGREADGEATVTLCCDLLWVTFPTRSQCVSIGLPRNSLVSLVPQFEDVPMHPIPRDNEALRLLKGYVNTVGETSVPATPELRRLVVTHVQDLVALMIDATRDAAAIGARCSVRAARLRAIKAEIAGHIGQQELTVSAVAARQGVSTRYVQMLFETERTTFSQYVLGQRLVRAHRMLTSPRYATWTISAIALEAGFGDLSHFNHAFRRVYTASPSDVRAAARRAVRRGEAIYEPKAHLLED